MSTATEQLEDVQAAIAKAEIGQSYRMADGRSVTRGDLKTLYERAEFLEKKISRAARGGISVRLARPERF